jgi:hypothetical protein
VKNGEIKSVTPTSGHYQPTAEFHNQLKTELADKGVDVSKLDWEEPP